MTRALRSKGFVPGLLALGPSGIFGPYTTATELDVDKAALHASDPLVEPASTNLSTFSLSGGKLIFFHGDSDPWFSPLDTLGYYKSLAATNGGADKVAEWSRMFLVPGMAHCGGGPSLDHFDMLTRCRQLGRERHGARFRHRHRPSIPRPQPPALRLSKARAVQRKR